MTMLDITVWNPECYLIQCNHLAKIIRNFGYTNVVVIKNPRNIRVLLLLIAYKVYFN